MSAVWLLAGIFIGYRLGRARVWISNVMTFPNTKEGPLVIEAERMRLVNPKWRNKKKRPDAAPTPRRRRS